MLDELADTLDLVSTGAIFETEKFRATPAALRRLNDIAFSGDGEPTTFKNFDEIIEASANLKRKRGLAEVKMVLITNASMFHRPHVKRGLEILDANQGEIWAKLEAGTEEYFRLVERTPIRFEQILHNITDAAKQRPLVIQALFMRINDQPPSRHELEQFCQRLREIVQQGGELKLVQIYTVARQPTESFVTPLTDSEVDDLVQMVGDKTGLIAQGFYGTSVY